MSISRLYDFAPNTLIQSSQVDDELNQLVAEVNLKFALAGGTVTGASIFSSTFTATSKFMAGLLSPQINNLSIVRATTTNAGDSIKITSADGTPLSSTNIGHITLPGVTAGQFTLFSITADVTILLTGAHWGAGTLGDLTGTLLRVLAVNDNGTIRWGVALLGGRNTVLTTDTNATQTNITAPEHILCSAAVSSSTNTCMEIGFVRANFDDTGGAAEDLWAIQSGVNDVVTGKLADGYWQPFNTTFTGFSVDPAYVFKRWAQVGRIARIQMRLSANGTSNATNFKFNTPFKLGFSPDIIGGINMTNNTVALTTIGLIQTTAGSAALDIYSNPAGAAWTGSGSKGSSFDFSCEVGPVASFIE